MSKKYQEIVFMQGEDSINPLQILNENGKFAAMEYLKQWECSDNRISDESPWGDDDDNYQDRNYILSWNNRLGYIGLSKIIE
jgi:hypothetical protein